MVDLINCSDLSGVAALSESEEIAYACIHVGYDTGVLQRVDDEVVRVRTGGVRAMLALAGGMDLGRVREARLAGADLAVVGRHMTGAPDPVAAAEKISEAVR